MARPCPAWALVCMPGPALGTVGDVMTQAQPLGRLQAITQLRKSSRLLPQAGLWWRWVGTGGRSVVGGVGLDWWDGGNSPQKKWPTRKDGPHEVLGC